jgi:hypothetical protein
MKREKKKEKSPKKSSWNKIFLISVCVVFILFMIFSGMTTSGLMGILERFREVRANDTVSIDFTLHDAMGGPVLTSDRNIYQGALARGYLSFITEPLKVRAGYIGSPAYTGVQAENYYLSRSGEEIRFGILGQELDEMDAGVLGMKTGETKTIIFSFADPLNISMTRDEFDAMGGNFTAVTEGDLIPLGLSETPLVEGPEGFNVTPQNAVWRIATVTNKTADSLEVEHRYPSVNITVREFE